MKLILLLSLALPGFAFAQSTCPERLEKGGTLQVHQLQIPSGECFVSVKNYKTTGGYYRNYLFTNSGGLMVFNSFGWEDSSTSTGAREFFFFPRRQAIPTFEWNSSERRLELKNTSGDVFYFDYDTGDLLAMNNGKVQVDQEIRKDNAGGVEISQYRGLLMDVGFMIGNAPSSKRTSSSLFKDAKGNTCKIKNSSLFRYASDGDVDFKLSDSQLKSLLGRSCPKVQM